MAGNLRAGECELTCELIRLSVQVAVHGFAAEELHSGNVRQIRLCVVAVAHIYKVKVDRVAGVGTVIPNVDLEVNEGVVSMIWSL